MNGSFSCLACIAFEIRRLIMKNRNLASGSAENKYVKGNFNDFFHNMLSLEGLFSC